jgi:hypothetical protein
MTTIRSALRIWPALLPVLFFLGFVLAPPLNHDVAAVLAFSQRWLDGGHLYVDLIDVNPPLIFVLNLLPASLAARFGIDAVTALKGCLLAWGAAVWLLALCVRDRAAGGPVERALLLVLPGLFVFAPGYDFGQRDCLMVASAVPYVYLAARRANGEAPRGRIAAAALAAVGFALKPYFLGLPVLVEAGVAVAVGRLRWRRDPVPWTMAALWLVYLACLPILFGAYLFRVVPMVWDLYIGLSGLSVLDTLELPRVGTAALALVALLWVAFRSRAGGRLPRILGLAALGALASTLVQGKGWSYHVVPLELLTLALATVLAARFLDALEATRLLAAPVLVGILGAAFVAWAAENDQAPWNELTYRDSDVAHLTTLLQHTAEGGRVLVLSPQISPIFPALNYAHARQTFMSMSMWMLQGSYEKCLPDGRRYREISEMPPFEALVFRDVAEQMTRQPTAVIVDRWPGIPDCNDVPFDFIAYFSRDPAFAEAWSHYRPAGEWERFRLYTRAE